MENNGDSGNKEFQPALYREDHSMKNSGYSTGTEDGWPNFLADDLSMASNGYSTGNEEFQLPLMGTGVMNYSFEDFPVVGLGEFSWQDIDGAVSDQVGARRNDDRNLSSPLCLRKRETDKVYRQKSKAIQERIKEERDSFEAENGQLKRQIEVLKCEIQEKDRKVEILLLKLENAELEKKVMKAEVGRVEAEKKLLQRELVIANQGSQNPVKGN